MTISFLISTYNRYEIINDAIKSVLNNANVNYEIIVVSDGQSDRNRLIVESYNDAKIKYYEVDHDNGWSARNYSAEMSTGDFVVFLDDDNIIYPNFFEMIIPLLNAQLGLLIYSIDLEQYHYPVLPKNHSITAGEIDTLNIIVNSKIAKNIKWEYEAEFANYPDYAYWKKCENYANKNNYQIKYIDNILACHRKIN